MSMDPIGDWLALLPDESLANIGMRLRQYRTGRALSRRQFGTRINVTASTISSWENGQSAIPLKRLGMIKEKFADINITWVLTGQGVRSHG